MDLPLFILAFIAGVLTFLAPCTFPLVPVYLAFISGVSSKDISAQGVSGNVRKKIFLNGVFYVIGFSVVFIFLGSLFGLAGNIFFKYPVLSEYQVWLPIISGVFVIFFGLYLMRFFELPYLKNFFGFLHQE